MIKEDIQFLLDLRTGSRVSVRGKEYSVVGRFAERYISETSVADAYVLSLSGQEELGTEKRGNEWHLWHSKLIESSYPLPTLRKLLHRLQNVERGFIERHYEEGEVGKFYPTYFFGETNLGTGVFLPNDIRESQLWFTENIIPGHVKII